MTAPTITPDATAQYIGPTLPQVCPGITGFRLAYVTPEHFDRIADRPTASSAMAARSAAKAAMADLDRVFGR